MCAEPLLTPRPGIMDLNPYVAGEHKIVGFEKVVVLSANESPLGPSPRALAAYKAAAEKLNRYPDGASSALRAALAKHHGLEAANITCANGSDELISLLTRAYAGPGDEVLFSEHGFAMYPIATLAAGATPVMAPETNLTADPEAFLARVTERTKIVFLANPNNPTGSFLPADTVAYLREKLRDDILLVLDAAYAEYVTRNDYSPGVDLVKANGNVVMLRTFSKAYALAGVRLGWSYSPPEVTDVLNRVRNPFNVTVPAQVAGLAAIDDIAHLDAARTHNDVWRPRMTAKLEGLGLEVAPSEANFLLVRFPDEPAKNADAANAYLVSRGIIPRGVRGYGLPEYLRITVGLEDEVEALVSALKDFLG
jgi:histidinol-phosphate aminotransferase